LWQCDRLHVVLHRRVVETTMMMIPIPASVARLHLGLLLAPHHGPRHASSHDRLRVSNHDRLHVSNHDLPLVLRHVLRLVVEMTMMTIQIPAFPALLLLDQSFAPRHDQHHASNHGLHRALHRDLLHVLLFWGSRRCPIA
jgi:hypothetical protein